MGYFTGDSLTRKIEEYDLTDLDKFLAGVVAGAETWPVNGFGIPAEPGILESTRIVVYSILHKYGLKNEFVVKMIPSKHYITIDIKNPGKHRAGGMVLMGEADAGFQIPMPVEEAEDLAAIFDEPEK